MPVMASRAIFIPSSDTENIFTVPSSSILISQPDSSTSFLMFLPPGPINAPIFSNGVSHEAVRNSAQLQIELKTGDAFFSARDFAIHVAERVFPTDDVGEQFVFRDAIFVVVLGAETNADSSDRPGHRHTRIHQCERTSADARHGGRTVRFHDLARDAN